MVDGSVVISIMGDRKHITKELNATRREIEKLESKLAEKVSERSGIEASLDEAMNAATATNEKIRALKREYNDLNRVLANRNLSSAEYSAAVARQAAITKELRIQTPILKQQDAEVDRLHSKYETLSTEINRVTASLDMAKQRAADLSYQDEMATVGDAIRHQLNKVEASVKRFQRRMLRILRNALLYNFITSTLHKAVTYFGQLMNCSEEYREQLAKLKGALLTAFQPLYEKIVPWAVSLLRILTSIAQVVGNFFTLLFGSGSLAGSASSAEALRNKAKAISSVGSAAKEAGKQLASFDQINKLGNQNSSGGNGGGASSGVTPDFSDLQEEEYQRKLAKLTAILSGSLLAIGAILFFSGTNLILGLALMAAGAAGLVNISSGRWGEVTEELRHTLNVIFGILSVSFLAIGAILLFSGGPINIARGIAMMAIGASALVGLAYINWNYIPNVLKEIAMAICTVGGYICVAVGIVLLFTGSPVKGIGLIMTGIGLLGGAVAISWTYLPDKLKEVATEICFVGGIIFVATGLALFFACQDPKKKAIGVGMMLAGAGFLAAAVALNWDSIPDKLKDIAVAICTVGGYICTAVGIALLFSGHAAKGIGLIIAGIALLGGAAAISWTYMPDKLKDIATEICVIGGVIFTAVGIALLFTGNIALGIGNIIAGVAFLAGAVALNWDSLQIPIIKAAYAICKLGGAVLLSLGMVLLFSGAGIPLGIGMIVAGLASFKLAEAIPWNGDAGTKNLMDTINSVTRVSGALLTAVGLVLVFSGAGIPLGLGLLAAGAGMLWSSYSTDYNDSRLIDLTAETEAKLAQTNYVKSAIVTATINDKSAGDFVAQVMQQALEMGMNADLLYQTLSEEMHLSDADIKALGFEIGGSGMSSYISGVVEGAEENTESVRSILARTLQNSVYDIADKVASGDINSNQAAHSLNFRIVELLKAGVLTPGQIKEILDSEEIQSVLREMGVSFQDGYAKGMSEGDEVAEEARRLTQSALDAIAKTQDSHSPSKKTASLAKDAVDGYVNELAASDDRVRIAGQTMVDSLTNGILSRTAVLDAALAHIVASANAMASSVVTAVNVAVEAMTSVSYTGSTIRIPAPTLYSLASTPLPKLATGAVIPPNAPFAAILGDQRSGTNIEAPLSTIQQAVSGVVRGDEQISLLKEQNRLLMAILERADVKLDGRSIAESTTSYQRQMSRASGGDGHGRI